MYLECSKIIFSGHKVEHLFFDGYNYFDNPARGVLRSKTKLKRLVNANCYQWKKQNGDYFMPLFMTFTFSEDCIPESPNQIKKANLLYRDFIKRFNYHIFDTKKAHLKYINVPEFGEKNGRLHFHSIFFNVPRISGLYHIVENLWENGYIWISSVKDFDDLGQYISKYITKSYGDDRFENVRKYNASQGLIRPYEMKFDNSLEGIREARFILDSLGHHQYEFTDSSFMYRLYDASDNFLGKLSSIKHYENK